MTTSLHRQVEKRLTDHDARYTRGRRTVVDALAEAEGPRSAAELTGQLADVPLSSLYVPAAHWVDDGTYPKGFFGLQIHKGSKGTVLWKNVRVKELTN